MKSRFHHYYTEEQDNFLKNNVKGISVKELTKRFNEHFNENRKETSIENRKGKLKLSSGIKGGQFQKGNIPINKGTKGMFNVGGNKTSFKKGNKPANWRPIGSERITKDGYIEIKIQDGKRNQNWIAKHKYLWEQKNGKVPKGSKLIFADGNKQNIDLNNIILVDNAEELIMNQNNLRFNDKELTSLGHTVAKVIKKTNEVNKR